MASIKTHLSKDGRVEFMQMLSDQSLRLLERKDFGVVNASGYTIEIIVAAGALGSLAKVLITWLKGNASRRVILQQNNKTLIQLQGYSVDEVKVLLASTTSITAAQTNKDNDTQAPRSQK